METQNQIKRTLSRPEVIEHIRSALDENGHSNRTMIAQRLCEHYGFLDARGVAQTSSCLKALRQLESKGIIQLPKPLMQWSPGSPKRLSDAVPPAQDVPEEVGDVHGLRLVLVGTEDQMRIWNEMMIREHPRGAGPSGGPLASIPGRLGTWLAWSRRVRSGGTAASGSGSMDRLG